MIIRNSTPCTAKANHSKRTFTLRVNGNVYRTDPMSKQDFNEALHMTSNDWKVFLRGNQYSKIK
jgi:hypothetical protein